MLRTNDYLPSTAQFSISYVIGVDPLLQYIVKTPKEKEQCMTFAFDPARKEYFDLMYDPTAPVGDWLHWTGQSMDWNSSCADCHSTLVQKNYHSAADTFSTSFRHIQITCEACQGYAHKAPPHPDSCSLPRSARVEVHSQKPQLESCAPCHSRRLQLGDKSTQKASFGQIYALEYMSAADLYDDGQTKGEVFEYHSFTQSKMYHKGVKCTNCHEPHSGKLLQVGNALCTQCHQKQQFDTPQHHHHPIQSAGASCVSCHMPGKVYMQRHYRHDHSLRIQRPDLSAKLATPDACSQSHSDRKPEWAAKSLEKWHGKPKQGHFSDAIALADANNPTSLQSLLQYISAQDSTSDAVRELLLRKAQERVPHASHKTSFASLLPSSFAYMRSLYAVVVHDKAQILPELKMLALDSIRMVRVQALKFVQLTDPQSISPDQLREYTAMLEYNLHAPALALDMGNVYMQSDRPSEAIYMYRRAIAADSLLSDAYINLILACNQQENSAMAISTAALAMSKFPKMATFPFYHGLLLSESKPAQALELSEKATRIDPSQAQYWYNAGVLCLQLGQSSKAQKYLLRAYKLDPQEPKYREALKYL